MKQIKIIFNIIILSLTFVFFSGCDNKFEKEAIGNYKVGNYKLIDSSINTEFPTLTLKTNKLFFMKFKSKILSGTWNITDVQEFTMIYFNFDDGHTYEGRIFEVSPFTIESFGYLRNFYLPNVVSLSFKKVQN